MNTTTISAVNFLLRHGPSLDASVSVVSVLYYESKLNPGSQGSQSTETPGALNAGGAYGIASWNGARQQYLKDFAAKKNLPVDALNTQLLFVLTEAANSYPKTWAAINGSGTYAEIIPVIVAEYENPKDHAKEIAGAMSFAEELMKQMKDQPPPPPQPPLDAEAEVKAGAEVDVELSILAQSLTLLSTLPATSQHRVLAYLYSRLIP
ncbi:MAG: phage tail tip lysozyme [Candidatus Saccharimonadales bacterium]